MKKRENKEKNPIDTKLLGLLAVECAVVLLIFSVCMYGAGSIFWGKIVYFGYLIIGVVLLITAVGFNGGFDTKLPDAKDIVGNLSMEERVAFIEKLRRRKEIAKKLLFLDFPFLSCLLIDTIYVLLPTGGWF